MNHTVTKAIQKKRQSFSLVWLIPIITLIIGAWLMIKTFHEQGRVIHISFKTAEGLEANKTIIKYKDIRIGLVTRIQLSDDAEHIIVTASIQKSASKLLRQGSRFWVEKPRISMHGVSGLGTLLKGSHIVLDPGTGDACAEFTGLDKAPSIQSGDMGRELVLRAKELHSITIGSPIYYRGLPAGEVTSYELSEDQKHINIHAFIKTPFDKLLSPQTRFWNISGVNMELGSNGMHVNIASLESLMIGGIAFENPITLNTSAKPSKDLLVCILHEHHDAIHDDELHKKSQYVIFFRQSVHGLKIGSAVEFQGIRIGKVIDIKLAFSAEKTQFRIPVLIEIDHKLIHQSAVNQDDNYDVQKLIRHGLRASLKTASLLTGEQYISFAMHNSKEAPYLFHDKQLPFVELPAVRDDFEDITQSTRSILEQLNKVDIVSIGKQLEESLQGINQLVNAQASKQSIIHLNSSLMSLDKLLLRLDQQLVPMSQEAIKTLRLSQTSLHALHDQLQSGSNVMNLSDELAETARSMRALIELIERHPNALLYGRPQGAPSP